MALDEARRPPPHERQHTRGHPRHATQWRSRRGLPASSESARWGAASRPTTATVWPLAMADGGNLPAERLGFRTLSSVQTCGGRVGAPVRKREGERAVRNDDTREAPPQQGGGGRATGPSGEAACGVRAQEPIEGASQRLVAATVLKLRGWVPSHPLPGQTTPRPRASILAAATAAATMHRPPLKDATSASSSSSRRSRRRSRRRHRQHRTPHQPSGPRSGGAGLAPSLSPPRRPWTTDEDNAECREACSDEVGDVHRHLLDLGVVELLDLAQRPNVL